MCRFLYDDAPGNLPDLKNQSEKVTEVKVDFDGNDCSIGRKKTVRGNTSRQRVDIYWF
ncbi:hypothetical protein C8R32_106138 [Nitrosospira sp. Nsp5]|uniref:Uncharacterized protein n=1 Tax=Nitrosospira multiformis TaxID=1231 RepID=A0ABY0T9C2_9PROT|nr:hypothetical protein C8R32_106138 [Nitrosospira sp. Nsp5]SDQ47868.1 hypothetical protein SAMN05216402_1013 [Nitrosospira multiformis]